MPNPFGERRNYTYGEIETPFKHKGQHFDRVIGQKLYQASVWRKWTFGLSLTIFTLLLLLFYSLSTNKPQVIVSEISPNGLVKSTQLLQSDANAPISGLYAFIGEYLVAVFVPQATTMSKGETFVKQVSSPYVFQALKPYIGTGSKIKIADILYEKPSTVKVKWQVFSKKTGHGAVSTKQYEATFGIQQKASLTKAQLLSNPFGFSIVKLKLNNSSK